MLALVLMALLAGMAFAQGQEERPAGKRAAVGPGELFVPEAYRPDGDAIDLVVQLHGSVAWGERNVVRAGSRSVVLTVARPGLSSVYRDLFTPPTVFGELLDGALVALKDLGVAEAPRIERLTVASFSAGFGGVREVLKVDDYYDRIDALVMADTIYAGFTGDLAERRVDPANMAGFLRFARDAAAGKKAMVVTYSQVETPTYASTLETARYLLEGVGLALSPASEELAPGFRCTAKAERGGLRVYGFAGDQAADHMRHLFNTWRLLELSRDERPLPD